MLAFPVVLLWALEAITKYPKTDRTLCKSQSAFYCSQLLNTSPVVTNVYPGIFVGVGIARGAWGLFKMYLKWSQTVRDKEFLVEMRLRNLEPEETKGKAVEKREQQQELRDEAVRDLPVLDLIENQSDGESDNEEERFLL